MNAESPRPQPLVRAAETSAGAIKLLAYWKPMSAAERFIDINVLLSLLSSDHARADRAEKELSAGGIVSVQVLNEFASVASRKLKMPAVAMPLRVMVTGEAQTPAIDAVCELLGREEVLSRMDEALRAAG